MEHHHRRRRVQGGESKRELHIPSAAFVDGLVSAGSEDSLDEQLRDATKVTQVSHAAVYPDRSADVETESFLRTRMVEIAQNCAKGLESHPIVTPVSSGGKEAKIVIRGVAHAGELKRLLIQHLGTACAFETEDDLRSGLLALTVTLPLTAAASARVHTPQQKWLAALLMLVIMIIWSQQKGDIFPWNLLRF